MRRRLLGGAVALCALLGAHGFDCGSGKCSAPEGLVLCGDVVMYGACLTAPSWAEQEAEVAARMQTLHDVYPLAINSTEDCADAVRRFQCAAVFSRCDPESDDGATELVCETECAIVRDACEYEAPGERGVGLGAKDDAPEQSAVVSALLTLDDQALSVVCDTGTLKGEPTCFELGGSAEYYQWAIGLALAVTFSFMNSVALNLQKLSLNRHLPETPVLAQPLWVVGFLLLLLGSIMDFVALGLAPASLLAPLAALSLVFNMAAAPCFLGEKLQKSQIIATMVIFSGAVLTVVFSSHESAAYTLQDLKALYLRPAMVVYTVVVPTFIMLNMAAIEVVEALPEERRQKGWLRRVHLIAYAGAAGTVGGQAIIFGKATIELFKSAFAGEPGLGKMAETYFIVFGLVLCMILQITYLNGGLMHHDSLSMVPLYQAFCTFLLFLAHFPGFA